MIDGVDEARLSSGGGDGGGGGGERMAEIKWWADDE
jgi:hypothetical protein